MNRNIKIRRELSTWTLLSPRAKAILNANAHLFGSYQWAFLWGRENYSGSSIRGRASKWGLSYSKSRGLALCKAVALGIRWTVATGKHGSRILILS